MGTFAQQLNTLAQLHYHTVSTGILASTSVVPAGSPPLQVRRPWLDPPEGYSPYDAADGLALPAVGAASTTNLTTALGSAAVLSFSVDDGYDGVINALSCNFLGGGFADFSGDIVWTLYADSKPIRNFQSITSQKGTVQQPRQVSPIRIYANQVITWVVTHVGNVVLNGNVVCTLTGFVYPNRG